MANPLSPIVDMRVEEAANFDSSDSVSQASLSAMNRYIVKVTSEGWQQPLNFLIPFAATSKVSELADEVTKRTIKFGRHKISEPALYHVHLQELTGPLLDLEDKLSDVVFGEELHFELRSGSQDDTVMTDHPTNSSVTAMKFRAIMPDTECFDVQLDEGESIRSLHDHICKALGIKVDADSTGFKIDMHTQEMPIHVSAFATTLQASGLAALAKDGIIVIYVVKRAGPLEDKAHKVGEGMSDIYRVKGHWQPETKQYDRGMAMLLSTLRVFTQLAKQHKLGDRYHNAVLNIFASLSSSPPATRTLHMLMQGKTPTASECAAFSAIMHELLKDIVPQDLIKHTNSRLFEGARLLFGFIAEQARQLAQGDAKLNIHAMDYHSIKVGDNTDSTFPSPPATPFKHRASALSGVRDGDVTIYRGSLAQFHDCLPDETMEEINDLQHLAGLCGQLSLAVRRPAALASVAAPALTFDEVGHVAVYTGRQPCAMPGEDMGIFRPHHGDSTPDMAKVEQAVIPFLQQYALEGTDVFDVLGAPGARQLQAPEEIIMFCVDCSQSMNTATDFLPEDSGEDDMIRLIDVSAFARTSFAATKAALSAYEGFEDVVGAVQDATDRTRAVEKAKSMLRMISILVLEDLDAKQKQLDSARDWTLSRGRRTEVSRDIEHLQVFAAGLRTFEDALVDFLVFRAQNDEKHNAGFWHIGDPVPATTGGVTPVTLNQDITSIPIDLRDPITYEVLQDPVKAADGQTYSHEAISQWFKIRKSSPLTGVTLSNLTLVPDNDLAERANAWVQAEDMLGTAVVGERLKRRRTSTASTVSITFAGSSTTFSRTVAKDISLEHLYKVAFRGMRGRHANFVLTCNSVRLVASRTSTAETSGIHDGATLNVLVFAEGQNSAGGQCLTKFYGSDRDFMFGVWTPRTNAYTLRFLLVKYWRYMLDQQPWSTPSSQTVWSNLARSGDNWITGSASESSMSLSTVHARCTVPGSLRAESVYNEHHTINAPRAQSAQVYKVLISPTQKKRDQKLTRLEVLKQMFNALINRMLAYSFTPHIGLVTVSSEARESQALTHVIEDFRDSSQGMRASGDTALWEGLALAKDKLGAYGTKFPSAKKRIICLSDGKDTKSSRSASEVYGVLRQNNIVVDSICIGDELNKDLKAISYLLGSYCFKPQDMTSALAICEMEPMLSLLERPEVQFKSGLSSNFYNAQWSATYTTATKDVYPPRKEHERMNDSFLELSAAAKLRQAQATSTTTPARSKMRSTRLLSEMRAIAREPNPQYDCYVSETDMSFWKVVMNGPSDTPYENGVFLLYLDMPEDFPSYPAKARFITPILHPNVNRHGRICHSIFDRDWTSDTSITSVLNTIYGLLFQADYSDPVHTTVTLEYHHDEVEFADEVREHVKKHAKKSREQWREELLELTVVDDGEAEDQDMPDSSEHLDDDEDEDLNEDDDEDLDDEDGEVDLDEDDNEEYDEDY